MGRERAIIGADATTRRNVTGIETTACMHYTFCRIPMVGDDRAV